MTTEHESIQVDELPQAKLVILAAELLPGDQVRMPATGDLPERYRTVVSVDPICTDGHVRIVWADGITPSVRAARFVEVLRSTPPTLEREIELLVRLRAQLSIDDLISLYVLVGMCAQNIRDNFGDRAYNDFVSKVLA